MRIPLDFAIVTEQTHVVAALGTAEHRVAKIESVRFLHVGSRIRSIFDGIANPIGAVRLRHMVQPVGHLKPQRIHEEMLIAA
jgi:hypothetical protein